MFSDDDLEDALLAFADVDFDEGGALSPGAALALTVIEALKRAASE